MSSAAVQTSSSALPNRQYQQPAAQYYQQQQSPPSTAAAAAAAAAASASSPQASTSRRHRSASGNGASPHTPQQPSQLSPTEPSTLSMAPSGQQAPVSHANNPSVTSGAAGPPIAPPQRTSSSYRGMTATAPAIDQQMGQMSIDAAQAASGSSRRRQQTQQDSYARASRAKEQPVRSRSQNMVGEPPIGTQLPREQSNIINRVVASDPQEDLAREQERMREAQGLPPATEYTTAPGGTGLGLVGSDGVDDGGRGTSSQVTSLSSRHSNPHKDPAKPRKEMKFGDYVLGQTLGEGEFGKVKLGWKRESGVQVAIKLIRKETLDRQPNRLPKIYREIDILRNLQHPNIVRLHEMVETQRHIGIILEYASGGELFDYILKHRYLKDQAARRLFAQLVSGVGYLHKKGFVHRDLKLENLLLDRNRNIIITDFGFANMFNPNDELTEENEHRLNDKEYIKAAGLDLTSAKGFKRGDLMQTSCGSPCYAAPELVVSDTLYTGRKVDVWSCGVILYAMLAGYLPFDDDPANPEGDNINLLYKYIVSTPLTFPDYVTPHARDLLKRILVPDPRKRADLFEVARHSWLSEYYHVVEFITSSTTEPSEVQNAPMNIDETGQGPRLGRSASVREPSKATVPASYAGPSKTEPQQGVPAVESSSRQRDTKRRTVQVEYVAPQQSTQRGDGPIDSQAASASRSRARADNQGPVEVAYSDTTAAGAKAQQQRSSQMAPPVRPGRDSHRAISDSTAFTSAGSVPPVAQSRPTTGGSLTANNRLPSRGNSYGQPVAATVAQTNAQGSISQPQGTQYTISAPLQQPEQEAADGAQFGRLSTQRLPTNQQYDVGSDARPARGHKRSNTLTGLLDRTLGRSGSTRGNNARPSVDQGARDEKLKKSYPPTSMRVPSGATGGSGGTGGRRDSSESRRSFSFARKTTSGTDATGAEGGSGTSPNSKRNSRRFSLLNAFRKQPKDEDVAFQSQERFEPPPRASVQLPRFGRGQPKHQRAASTNYAVQPQQQQYADQRPAAFSQRSASQTTTATQSTVPALYDSTLDRRRGQPQQQLPSAQPQGHISDQLRQQPQPQQYNNYNSANSAAYYGSQTDNAQLSSVDSRFAQPQLYAPQLHQQQQLSSFDADDDDDDEQLDDAEGAPSHLQQQQQQAPPGSSGRLGTASTTLHRPARRFEDAYAAEGPNKDHSGSSSAARRVANFFRRRGKNRGEF